MVPDGERAYVSGGATAVFVTDLADREVVGVIELRIRNILTVSLAVGPEP